MLKLFFTFVITILLISLPAHISGRSINIINGVINCDGIVCPTNSVACTVSEKTGEDLNFYKYRRTCYDDEGNATSNVEKNLPNPNPGSPINSLSRVGGTPTQEEKQQLEYWQNWGERQGEYWNNWGKKQQEYWNNWEKKQQEYWNNWAADLND